jgi:hypothetical protein
MNTPLRLSQEPVSPTIEAAAAHAEDISNTFRDLQIVLPPDTLVRRDDPCPPACRRGPGRRRDRRLAGPCPGARSGRGRGPRRAARRGRGLEHKRRVAVLAKRNGRGARARGLVEVCL